MPGKVAFAYIHGSQVSALFAESLAAMVAYDLSRPESERVLGGTKGYYSGVNVAGTRNHVVREFLDVRTEPWLCTVDADMFWRPDAVDRLLAVADPQHRPIVGGLCFGADDDGLFPTLYELADGPDGIGFYRLARFPLGGPVQVSGTGAAFLLIHRRVLEAIRDKAFSRAFPWFQETEFDGGPVSEDLTFCLRAGMLGFPIYVNTACEIGHHKQTALTAAKWLQQQGVELHPAEPLHREKPVIRLGEIPTPGELAGLSRGEAVTHAVG